MNITHTITRLGVVRNDNSGEIIRSIAKLNSQLHQVYGLIQDLREDNSEYLAHEFSHDLHRVADELITLLETLKRTH